MIGWPNAAGVPVELSVGFFDRQVVDAGVPPAHQTAVFEVPVLIAVGTEPSIVGVVILVAEPHSDPVPVVCPEFLDQSVVEFALPLAGEKVDDFRAALDEGGPVAPPTVLGVGLCDRCWVARVPAVFG